MDKVQILLFPQSDMDTTPFNHFVTLNGRFSQFYNDSRDNPSFYNINLKYALTHDFNKTSYLGNIITLGKAFDRSPLFTFRYRQIMAGIGLVYYKTIPIKNNNKLILGLDLIQFYEFINEETSFRVDDEEQTGISSSLSIGLNFEMKKIKIAPIISGDFVYRDQLGYSPYRRSVDVKFGVLMEL